MKDQISKMLETAGLYNDENYDERINTLIEEMHDFVCAHIASAHAKAYNEGWEAHIKYASEGNKEYKEGAPNRMRWIKAYYDIRKCGMKEAIEEYDKLFLTLDSVMEAKG